jgi:diguanylate cyclase (GGDEF)-like protein
MTSAYTVLCCGLAPPAATPSAWGEWTVQRRADLGAAAAYLGEHHADAVLVQAEDEVQLAQLLRWPSLAQAARDSAVVVVAGSLRPDWVLRLAALGVQDVLASADDADTLARALRMAIERQRRHARVRDAGNTDLGTGLPHRAQLLEHMTQLLALREREPAPMAVLALRLDGLQAAEAQLGTVCAQILRRKAAVRLRAALRASDVVAAIDAETFVVLLAWIEQPADGPRVAQKLVQALTKPLRVAGQEVTLGARVGVGLYPAQGRDADALLRAALHEAAQGHPLAPGARPNAANDGAA